LDFAYDGGGIGKGGTASLFIDGEPTGSGRVDRTEIFIFSVDETCDVGYDAGSPVTDDYITTRGRFNGRVNWVELAVDGAAENNDHLITTADRLRLALGLH
jgi:arylsulfatase